MEKQEFIELVRPGAIRARNQYGILPSLTIAQAILESNWGRSAPGNMLFGIKWTEGCGFESQLLKTKEYQNGQWITVYAKFRKYESMADSVADHAAFLKRNRRYSNLLGVADYKTACRLIKEDGYATDPNYTYLLINLIESNNLQKYDEGWASDGQDWYYYKDGKMAKNAWAKDSKGKWFYLGEDGKMARNRWAQDSSKQWFYLGPDGEMVTNKFEKDSHGWCYLKEDGAWDGVHRTEARL